MPRTPATGGPNNPGTAAASPESDETTARTTGARSIATAHPAAPELATTAGTLSRPEAGAIAQSQPPSREEIAACEPEEEQQVASSVTTRQQGIEHSPRPEPASSAVDDSPSRSATIAAIGNQRRRDTIRIHYTTTAPSRSRFRHPGQNTPVTGDSTRRSFVAAAVSLAATTVVVAVKLVAAMASGSISVLAEGLQSTVDVLMSLLALVTIRYAALPPDEDHPYGHGKAELLAGAFQMLLVLGSAAFILFEVAKRWRHAEAIAWDWGAMAMAYAAVSNLTVSAWLRKVARETGSPVLHSEVQHLNADTLTSIGVLGGLLVYGLTRQPWVDPLVATLFTLWAIVAAARQLRAVLHPLMDGALPAEEIRSLEAVLNEHPEVRGYHALRTRMIGTRRMVELHVMLDDALPFVEAHDIAEQIEGQIRDRLGNATVSIHYEPYEAEIAHRQREHGEARP